MSSIFYVIAFSGYMTDIHLPPMIQVTWNLRYAPYLRAKIPGIRIDADNPHGITNSLECVICTGNQKRLG